MTEVPSVNKLVGWIGGYPRVKSNYPTPTTSALEIAAAPPSVIKGLGLISSAMCTDLRGGKMTKAHTKNVP